MLLEKDGFQIIKKVINKKTADSLIKDLSNLKLSATMNRKDIYGVRNLLNLSPQVREFAESRKVREIVEDYLGEKAKIVRAIYFDKTPEANWKVP